MGATTIDELSIEISAKSQKADKAIDALVEKLDRLEKGLLGLSSAQNKTSKGFDSANKKIVQVNKAITNIGKTTQTTQSAFSLLANNFRSIIGVSASLGISLATLNKAFEKLKASTMDYSELMENINFQNVALDKISEQWKHQYQIYGYESAEEYAASFRERLAQTLGNLTGMTYDIETGLILSTGQASLGANLQGVTLFQAQLLSLTNSLGLTGEASYQTANAFSYLAADIASLNGLNFDDVAQKLRSGLLGSSEVLYNLGIDATDAALQVTALKYGIDKAVSSMSQAEKTQLRFLTVLESSSVAYGDQARTINSLSNMMKLFESTTADISVLIGQVFAPVLLKTLPIINGFAIALKDLLSNIATALNIDTGNASTSFEGLGDTIGLFTNEVTGADKATQKLKKSLLGFDKLNVISTASASSGSALSAPTGIDLTEQIMQASQNYTKIAEDAYADMVSFAQNAADNIKESFATVWQGFGGSFKLNVPLFQKHLYELREAMDNIFADKEVSESMDNFKDSFLEMTGAGVGTGFSNSYSILSGVMGGTAAALGHEEEYIKDKITNIFTNLKEASEDSTEFFNGISSVGKSFESVGFRRIVALLTDLNIVISTGVLDRTINLFTRLWSLISKPFSKNADLISESFSKVFEILSNLMYPITLITDKLGLKFSEESSVNKFLLAFENINTVVLTGILESLNAFLDVIIEITNYIPKAVDALKEFDGFDFGFKLPKIYTTGTSFGFGGIGANIQGFATGGFPKEDGLFYANHTELVGRFSNGKTAVANNQQITDGIEEAAYRGMMRALATQGGSANVNVTLEGDAGRLFRVVRKEADSFSRVTGRPAF